MSETEERVDRLEAAIQEFVHNVGIEFNKLYNSQMRTEAEMRAFKDEMREFKDEMRAFKGEMSDFKDESRRANREMNRRWGELANKMGTLVEDLVAPSLSRIVREVLDREVTDLSVRRKRRLADGRTREFDAIAVTEDQRIGLNSTRQAECATVVEESMPNGTSAMHAVRIPRYTVADAALRMNRLETVGMW